MLSPRHQREGTTMAEAHEEMEQAEHVEHASHTNRRIALLIAVLALFLAFSETLGKSAQTAALSDNIEASDLWAFFQAKTIRQTVLRTAADTNAIELAALTDPGAKSMMKLIDDWKKTIERYESDPESREGRKELTERARETEHRRDVNFAKYENYELASAAFQIGIVLASATIITGIIALAYVGGILTLAGLVMTGLGLWWPHLLHLHG